MPHPDHGVREDTGLGSTRNITNQFFYQTRFGESLLLVATPTHRDILL